MSLEITFTCWVWRARPKVTKIRKNRKIKNKKKSQFNMRRFLKRQYSEMSEFTGATTQEDITQFSQTQRSGTETSVNFVPENTNFSQFNPTYGN
uniref:hypothetical protein n=1 Tax=Polynucleobacter sp. TaxID=2029855 RepID=UPI0040471C03